MYKREFTPERIESLQPQEIFVFGSNLGGYHGGGAAAIAMRKFGAIWGQGVGLQGQSYAIPTMQGGVETIKPYVDEFIAFATEQGFRDEEIAPLFAAALKLPQVILPESFVRLLEQGK